MLPFILLLFGFVCLIFSADQLVSGASSLAKRIKISDIVIGMTVVAFGTSTPELFVNILAAINGNTQIAFTNVVGSNIVNILLILGVCAVIYPLKATQGTVMKEIPFSFLAAIVLAVTMNDKILANTPNILSRGDSLVLLCFFIIFLYYTASIAFEIEGIEQHSKMEKGSLLHSIIRIFFGLAGLMLGGWLVVDNATIIATNFGLSESLIGLTIVAVGTSLPEFATSAMAAYRGNADIAIGNVVGSNIFNILFILGVTALIRPIPLSDNGTIEFIALIASSAFLFLFMFTGKKRCLDRWEGLLFLLGYMVFVGAKIAI